MWDKTLDLVNGHPYHARLFGALAQLGERNTGSVEVSGSIPLGSTKFTFYLSKSIFYKSYQIAQPFRVSALASKKTRKRQTLTFIFRVVLSISRNKGYCKL